MASNRSSVQGSSSSIGRSVYERFNESRANGQTSSTCSSSFGQARNAYEAYNTNAKIVNRQASNFSSSNSLRTSGPGRGGGKVIKKLNASLSGPGRGGKVIKKLNTNRAIESKNGSKQKQKKAKPHTLNVTEEVQSKMNTIIDQLSNEPVPTDASDYQLEYFKRYLAADESLGQDLLETPRLRSLKNANLDDRLRVELGYMKSYNAQYKSLLSVREKLPVYALKSAVTDVILRNQVTVISGETGSGKTTQIPQFILDQCIKDGNGSTCNIICTQPRRISAITVAERVAEERGEIVGISVGYSIRLESKLPTRSGGTLTFLVAGVLLQRLRSDPLLHNCSHIIVDEVHERDILSDFTLVILKDLIIKRPDLKVILMSATLNANKFSEYFPGSATFKIPGFTYPVQEYYLEHILQKTGYKFPEGDRTMNRGGRGGSQPKLDSEFHSMILPWVQDLWQQNLYSPFVLDQLSNPNSELVDFDLIQATIEYILRTDNTGGAILVFVAGWAEISSFIQKLEKSYRFPRSKFQIYPLHSLMPTASQKEIFKTPPVGIRKIIIATNIAETSITIDDVNFVIDTGRIKMTNFNVDLNLQTLDLEWVSRANATQRKGRAGRTRPGQCFHLFSQGREKLFDDFKKPEILRTKLEVEVLRIKNLKFGKAADFFSRFPDPPNEKAAQLACVRLEKIGALDYFEELTPLGSHLAKLPMDPYTGKMIIMAAIFSCVDPIFSIAASLNFKECFTVPFGEEKKVREIRMGFAGDTRSDHIAEIRAIQGCEEAKTKRSEANYCYQNYISLHTMNQLERIKTQFAQYLYEMKFLPSNDVKSLIVNQNSKNTALLKAIITAGLYPNLAVGWTKSKEPSDDTSISKGKTEEDGCVNFHPKSVNAKPKWSFESPFHVYYLKQKSTLIYLHDSTMITPFPLIFFGGKLDYEFDEEYATLCVDYTTRFECSKILFDMFQSLRSKLDNVLESKFRNPGLTLWNESKDEKDKMENLLLKAILDLLIMEHKCYDLKNTQKD